MCHTGPGVVWEAIEADFPWQSFFFSHKPAPLLLTTKKLALSCSHLQVSQVLLGQAKLFLMHERKQLLMEYHLVFELVRSA